MKQLNKFLLTLLLSGAGTAGALAEYHCDFNTPITTSNPSFIVADGWGHKLDSSYTNDESYNTEMYVYLAAGGVDGTGALRANVQDDGAVTTVYDYLITPPVKGTVTVMAKDLRQDWDGDDCYVEVWAYNKDTQTVGSKLKTIVEEDIPKTEYTLLTLADNLSSYQCLAIRLQHVAIDDFKATSIEGDGGGDDDEPVVPKYTCNFDTPIAVSSPNFKVASNWRHKVGSYSTSYSGPYYMKYEYQASNGVDGSGCLFAENQEAGSSSYNMYDVYDYLITPKVKGNVSLMYKTTSYSSAYPGYIEVYEYDEDTNQVGDLIKKISSYSPANDFQVFTLTDTPIEDFKRLAIRIQRVRIDNFTADDVEIELEPGFAILSAQEDRTNDPNPSSGTVNWVQTPDGTVPITFKVKIQNTGEVDLTQGMEKYSLSLFTNKGVKVGESVAIPFDLAKGEESDEFSVTFTIQKNDISSIFNTYAYFDLQDDFNGEGKSFGQSMCVKYESKFYFVEKGSTSSYSLSSAQSYGVVTESLTKEYEIKNTGIAPLEIVSITYPDGFSSTLTENAFTIAGNTSKVIPITLGTDGDQNGNLVIEYKLYGEDTNKTYSLGFNGTKVAEGIWYNDFNGAPSTLVSPGAIAESNIECNYNTYHATNADNYIYCRYSSNTRFFTPLLHAEAGDTFSFDIKKYSSSGNGLNVYVTQNRAELGEPVMTIAYADLPSSWEKKSITLDEEGDYIIVFSLYGVQLDNLAGLRKVEKNHDVYISQITFSDYSVVTHTEKLAGEAIEPSMTVYALTDLLEEDYTVKFILNNEEVATAESIDFDANPKTSKKFKISYAPEVTETVTYEGFFRIEFEDGTIFDSPKVTATFSYESKFAFGKGISYSKNYPPTSDTNPIVFEKTNQTGTTVTYRIANSGGAPLNVTSLTTTGEFSVSPAECVVPGLSNQDVEITFTAETAGEYEGEIEISYEGMEEPYKLPIQGILLDPSKWYANFESDPRNTTGSWPDGSVVQSGMGLKNAGTTTYPNMVLYTSKYLSDKDRTFISPLLSASEGETLTFDARYNTTGTWDTPTVKVWAAQDRNSLLTKNDEGGYDNAILLLDLSKLAEDEANTLADNFKTYSVTAPAAGQYYLGFELSYFAEVDEIAGFTPVQIDADLTIDSASIPSDAMQNVQKAGKINLRNFLKDIEAGAYTYRSYVDGQLSIEREGDAAIPASHLMSDKAIEIVVPFRSPKPGTFPVFFELSVGDVTITTEPTDVTFLEEVLTGGLSIGTHTSFQSYSPFTLNDKNTESIYLFTNQYLSSEGLKKGDEISSITLRGYKENDEKQATVKVYYQWVDDAELQKPSSNSNYDTSEMTVIYDGDYTWKREGSSTEVADLLSLTLAETIIVPEGKHLVLFFGSYKEGYGAAYWETTSVSGYGWKHSNDGTAGVMTGSWSTVNLPVLHLGLVVEPRTLSGTVTNGDDNEAVADATVTLISNDGDNVQYETTTDENGEFSINVIQSGREYNVEVAANGKEDFVNGVSVAEESLEQDFVLLDVIQISDDSDHSAAPAEAVAYLQKALNPGYNAIALPIALSQVETEAIFGEDAVIYEFNSVLSDPEETTVMFSEVFSKEMEAGVPYLVYIEGDEARPVEFKFKGTMADLKTETSLDTDFLATTKRTPVAEKMFVLSDENFVSASKARTVTELPAYSGYIKSETATSLNFTTDENYQTLIKDAEVVNEGEDVIYDLNGLRVKNPEKGIYIINGKAVRVK